MAFGYAGQAFQYMHGNCVKQNNKKTLELVQKVYEKNDPDALLATGMNLGTATVLWDGADKTEAERKSMELLLKAAGLDSVPAKCSLADRYQYGIVGAERSLQKSLEWYQSCKDGLEKEGGPGAGMIEKKMEVVRRLMQEEAGSS